MKKVLVGIAALSLLAGCNNSASISNIKLETQEDSVSYAIGVMVGTNITANDDFKTILNTSVFAAAVEDIKKGDKSEALSAEEAQNILSNYAKTLSEKAKKKGEDFLTENKKKEGIKVTESGLQYEIITEGTGPKPSPNDMVRVHYHGTLIDGTVFDSSVERGEPAQFPVGGVIQGWVEALQLMPVGSKWKIYVPQELAYGARGAGQDIAPYSALIFEVELLEIVNTSENPEMGQ